MKGSRLLIACALLSMSPVHAESIEQIFKSIADSAVIGNGGSHYVTNVSRFSEKREMTALLKEANKGRMSCRYTVEKGINQAISNIKKNWDDAPTASRLEGMAKKGLIRQIIYSSWDPSTGDSEYCLMSTIKVYAVDGSVLVLDYNQTD